VSTRAPFVIDGKATGRVRVKPSASGLRSLKEPLSASVEVTVDPGTCSESYECSSLGSITVDAPRVRTK
jgi:hypothetical protein